LFWKLFDSTQNDISEMQKAVKCCVSTEAAHEKPSSLPLNSNNPLLAMMMAAGDKVTPQQALLQTMAAMHQKVSDCFDLSSVPCASEQFLIKPASLMTV